MPETRIPLGYAGNIPQAAVRALEDEAAGVMHGIVTLSLHVKDGNLTRYVVNRERSFVPGKPMTGDGQLQYSKISKPSDAEEKQEEHREVSPYEGITLDFINREVPENWETWKLDSRILYWSGGIQGNIKTVPRSRICSAEVWCEALREPPENLNKSISRDINSVIERTPGWIRSDKVLKYGPHSNQRGFVRGGKIKHEKQ